MGAFTLFNEQIYEVNVAFFTVVFYGARMKGEATVKTWEKTRLQNLVRHKSGGYYVRLYLNGKEVWKSLKTTHYSVAEARLATCQKEHRDRRSQETISSNAKMTFGEAATLHLKRVADDVNLKRRTRAYWRDIGSTLLKSWPGLVELEVRRATPAACREWAARFSKKVSATRYNGALSYIRRVFDLAIESGVLPVNPARALKRATVRAKKVELPTRSQFVAFIAEMRAGRSRDSGNCADLAEGLALTGCRISEATQISWRDLDFSAGEITVRGDPVERTKNGEIRHVPMVPGASELFARMKVQRANAPAEAPVFAVRECQNAMNRAAKKIGMTRITHHDLRHFFATICIESGVDIPTVSRWLGHKDGGALAMRTYGHLRREHSVTQAQKVSFAPIHADAPTPFVAKVGPSQPVAPMEKMAISSQRQQTADTSWVESVSDEPPKKIAKRSAVVRRLPESRSLS